MLNTKDGDGSITILMIPLL